MNMKRIFSAMLALMLVVLTLSACHAPSGGKTPESTPTGGPTETSAQGEEKVVQGIINHMGNYLVLLTEDDEYQIMDFGEGVTADGFSEGDRVEITYTGILGQDDPAPVIKAIAKAAEK